jgi:hypothetical protein
MPTLDETEQITGAWAHTVLGEDNSEWIETLDVLKVIGVRAIRVELDRTGYRHKEFESPNWCPESDWRLHRNADYYRHKIDTATTTRVRAQWADRLAASRNPGNGHTGNSTSPNHASVTVSYTGSSKRRTGQVRTFDDDSSD